MNERQIAPEKRRIQRVRLVAPLQAEVDSSKVMVVDISAGGARIEHHFAVQVGSEVTFTVRNGEDLIALRANVVRCRLDRSVSRDAIVYHSGLQFPDSEDAAVQTLLRLIRDVVNYDLEARNNYAGGKSVIEP